MPRWLLVLLMIFVGFCLLSMAAFVCLPWILQSFHPPVGTVIVYEMEDVKATQNAAELAEKTVAAINSRLNPSRSLGEARVIEGNRIEVSISGDNPPFVKNAVEKIELEGKLEFRILANMHKHKAEIERAKAEPEKSIFFDSAGEWSARWVPIKDSKCINPEGNLLRTRKIKDEEITEVLVVRDPYDVTGEFLVNARLGGDERGQPCVNFTFNSAGGQLFGMLTQDNLPSDNLPIKNQLCIILNGVIYSAPSINSVITDRGQITGNFTHWEISSIVNCLNASPLPVKLHKVEERAVKQQR